MARTNDPEQRHLAVLHQREGQPLLDFGISGAGYAVFGEVVEGMDVVDKIVAVATTTKGPHQNVPVEPIVIRKATVAERRRRAASADAGSRRSAGHAEAGLHAQPVARARKTP